MKYNRETEKFEDTNKFYDSFYVRGARPFINWSIGLGVFIVFPFQIALIVWNTVFSSAVFILPNEQMNQLTYAIIPIVLTIIGSRTYEKIKGVNNELYKE